MTDVDARGLPCPQPVLLTKKAVGGGEKEVRVLVDNAGSAENVRRFAERAGYAAAVGPSGADFEVRLVRGDKAAPSAGSIEEISCPAGDYSFVKGRVLLITSDVIGRGSDDLGHILVRAFLNALAENAILPEKVILLNAGVRLACQGDDTVEALDRLQGRGVEIMACGTCLKFYGLLDKLRAGHVSNAYEILNTLLQGNVVSW